MADYSTDSSGQPAPNPNDLSGLWELFAFVQTASSDLAAELGNLDELGPFPPDVLVMLEDLRVVLEEGAARLRQGQMAIRMRLEG